MMAMVQINGEVVKRIMTSSGPKLIPREPTKAIEVGTRVLSTLLKVIRKLP